MTRRFTLFIVFLAVLSAPALVSAQYSGTSGLSGLSSTSSFFGQGNDQTSMPLASVIPSQEGIHVTLGLRKYINSFSSNQFPDPPWGGIGSDPLSRLEWPWEQIFDVIKLRYTYRGIQVNIEGAATLFTHSRLKSQDSDWFDPNNPGQKIVFSDAQDFPRCWTFDTGIGYTIPAFPSLQCLMGYRAQQFCFTATNGMQRSLWAKYDWGPLPGAGTEFSQYYKIYYFGGALSSWLPYNLFVRVSGDVGYVTANNTDYHVRRTPAPRFDYDTTRGISWHANLATEYRFKDFASLGLAGDFMRITTTGGHHLKDPVTDQSWDGAKVWSEQKYIEANTTLIF